jgi:hypothetical protein
MAEHYVAKARGASDARYRSFLIDLATTWCNLAGEFLDGAPKGLERLEETAKMVAELDCSEPRDGSPVEGLEPRMIPRLVPRIVH